MEVVGQAATGREALEMFEQLRPDVTLIDLRMPDMNGVEAITAIRKMHKAARIVILTTYDGDENIHRGLKAGAQAYLLKDVEDAELLQTIRAVHAGRKYIPPRVGARLAERVETPELSEREQEVLRLMARGRTNREIGLELHIAEGTVKFHINHILAKLGANDRTEAVIIALKRGLASLD
jgi:DNA-binding NarL/FixJ family response regulator